MVVSSDSDLWDAFERALDQVDLEHRFDREAGGTRRRWDGTGEIEHVPVVVEVKAVPTVADVARWKRHRPKGAYPVVVARRVSQTVADALTSAGIGFFDARGRLRIWQRPLLIDTTIAASDESSPTVPASWLRLDTASVLDVALAVLDGTAGQGVRATAAIVGRAPGTVSKQLAALRSAGLVDDALPMVPDLFEAVVDIWHPQRLPLADLPRPGAGRVNERLHVGFGDVGGAGWVLADVAAAAAWGAPVVVTSGSPPDFYVPDRGIVALARTLFGPAEYGSHACTVAVAPSPYVCRRRHDQRRAFGTEFLAPSPVVAALDLATDPARGREMLELWSRDLSHEVLRVW